jgi:hypothetical protein
VLQQVRRLHCNSWVALQQLWLLQDVGEAATGFSRLLLAPLALLLLCCLICERRHTGAMHRKLLLLLLCQT